MAEPEEHEPTVDAGADLHDRTGSWWFVVVPAITLLVGLVLGGLIVGVAHDGSKSPDVGPSATPTPADPSASSDVAVVVPQECLQAAETVQRATELIRDGVAAIRDFRPDELITLLDQLEDLDAEAREQAAACSEVEVSPAP